jgi:DNA modification methylase
MSAAPSILSPEAVTGAHGSSLQRLVGRHGLTATLYNADCLDVLPIEADAVVSDPPYGMAWDGRIKSGKNGHAAGDARRPAIKIHGDDEPFDPSPWLDYPRVVLFGCNHYAQRLPVGTTLIWVKKFEDAFCNGWLSDAEIAWMKGGFGCYCKRDTSHNAIANEREHPAQKPVTVMAWCLDMAKVPLGATVLDPYMGSGSTGIACLRTGRNFIGIERDAAHYATAVERIRQELDGALL